MSKSKKINILKKARNAKIILNQKYPDIAALDVTECRLELRFNREIIIDGCKGVIDYSDQRISVNAEKGIVIIEGTGLCLQSFDEHCAVIVGTFTNIQFEV